MLLGIFCSPCFSWIVPCSWSGGSYSCHQSIAFCHIQLDSFFKICLQTRQTSSDRRSELRVLLLAVSAYKNNTENVCRYQWWWHQPITGQSSWHLTNSGWLGLLCTMQSIRPWAAGEDTPEARQPPDWGLIGCQPPEVHTGRPRGNTNYEDYLIKSQSINVFKILLCMVPSKAKEGDLVHCVPENYLREASNKSFR